MACTDSIEHDQLLAAVEGGDASPLEAPVSQGPTQQRRLTKPLVASGLVVAGVVAWAASRGTATTGRGEGATALRSGFVGLAAAWPNASMIRLLEDDSLCAAAGSSCLKSECCKDAGMKCYTKNEYWAQCMASCVPGPNVQDQTSPMPWACKELGSRTKGEAATCSGDGADCSETGCCTSGGTQCFRKDTFWSTCKASCTPGPDMASPDNSSWDCKAMGPRNMGAAPWVADKCAKGGEDCRQKGCCAEAGHQCYKQSDYYGKCRPSCTVGEKLHQWDPVWDCGTVGMRTPPFEDSSASASGLVGAWVPKTCSSEGANCLDSKCCLEVGAQCYRKNEFWGICKPTCDTAPDPNDDNKTWSCEGLGPRSWGLATKGWPSLYCVTLYMPSGYERGLLKSVLEANAGIFHCDGYDVFAAEDDTLGTTKDNITVKPILIPKISVGVSQDGTAGNAKLFMAVWDKVIAGGRFRNYDWTIKVDPDAVLIPWRIRDHMQPHNGQNLYVVNCNKVPGSPNFPMMFGAVEIFSQKAMISYALSSWKCGKQLPWKLWGEDYYMTHCMDFIGVGRIGDFGVLGDNMCSGANCKDSFVASFHPFKDTNSWMQCWGQATMPAPAPAPTIVIRK